MKLYNIVKVYTATTGTGTVTLGSAVPSFITFATAGVTTGSTVSYAIEDGNNREVGTGVYTSGAETLTRNVVTSTNSNNLITLSGNAVVFITGLAADLSSATANTASTLVLRDGSGNFAAGAATLSSVVFNGSSSGTTTVQASATASGTLTLPATTDTLIGKATSDTLTNKTYDTAGTGNVLKINGTQVSAVTGTGSVVLATSPTLVTPALGTPTSGTLTSCTGLPISTGVSGLGTGVATFLGTPSSANLASAVTDETGSGALVFATSPTLVTPLLGTPTSGTLTNCTGLPVSSGISGLGSGVATFLGTPSSANLASAVTDETGSGALVFGTSPTIATPTITTSAVIPIVNGGTSASSTLTLQSTSGAGTSDAIIFKTASQSERMRINSTGDVLVGSATDAGNTLRYLDVYNTNTGSSAGTIVRLITSNSAGTGTTSVDIVKYKTGLLNIANNDTSGQIAFGTGGSESMRIDSSGNVGIGTSSPLSLRTLNLEIGPQGTNNGAAVIVNKKGTGIATLRLATQGAASGFDLNFNFPTTGYLGFYDLASGANRMVIDTSGNVGIGTTSPKQLLHVAGQGVFTTSNASYDPGDSTGTAVRIGYSTGGDYGYVICNQTGVASKRLLVGGSTVEFLVSGLEKGRFNADGKFGIGTTSPLTTLQVGAVAALNGDVTLSAGTNMVYQVATDGASLTWNANTNGGNANTIMAQLKPRQDTSANYNLDVFCGTWNNNNSAGTAIATFQSTGKVGIGTTTPVGNLDVHGGTSGRIEVTADGANQYAQVGITPNGTGLAYLSYGTTAGNTLQFYSKKTGIGNVMAIDATGNVGIGISSPSYQLQLSTDSAAKPTTNTWTIASDERLKTVKGEYTKGLSEICQVRPIRYEYNGKGGFSVDGKEQISIIAQELAEVFPECVGTFSAKLNGSDTEETELYNYNGHAITFALINAIKELKAEIDLLKSRN